MQKTLGWIMLLAGMFMLIIGFINPLTFLIVDTTPPSLTTSNPSSGSIIAQIDQFTATITDSSSGVKEVYFSLANLDTNVYLVTQQPMTLINGDKYNGTWKYTVSPTVTTSGKYVVYVQAGDYAGNWLTQMIEWQVYSQLQGKWYINDQELVSSNQTIYSKTNTVTFKFVKSAGISDANIKCWVEYPISTKLIDVSYAQASVWNGSYTFNDGKYDLKLVANDGTTTITFSVISLQVGGVQWPQFNTLQIFGLASTGIGLLLIFTDKTRAKKR